MAWLIDDHGECHDSASALLRADLHALHAGSAFIDYTIKNMGFVGLNVARRRDSAVVTYRPETIAPMAFARLQYWLADGMFSRVLVATYRAGDWHHQLHGSVASACSAITATVRGTTRCSGPLSDDEVLSQPASMTALPLDSPLHAAFARWRDADGDWSRLAEADSFEQTLSGRFVLFEQVSGDFWVAQFGSRLPTCAVTWLRQAHGQRVQDQPDRKYGWSCALAYKEAVQRNEPALHDVDAFVRWNGETPVRRRYKRLLLPLREGSRLRYLLSASVEDPGINLRPIAA